MNLVIGVQVPAARALLNKGRDRTWTQEYLAHRADLSIGTIQRMEESEDGIPCLPDNIQAVHDVLERAGIRFVDDGEPGVRLTHKRKR